MEQGKGTAYFQDTKDLKQNIQILTLNYKIIEETLSENQIIVSLNNKISNISYFMESSIQRIDKYYGAKLVGILSKIRSFMSRCC